MDHFERKLAEVFDEAIRLHRSGQPKLADALLVKCPRPPLPRRHSLRCRVERLLADATRGETPDPDRLPLSELEELAELLKAR